MTTAAWSGAEEDFRRPSRMSTISGMAILVVDDDQAVRDALRRALTMQGYDVDLAADGEEALLKLRSHPNAHDLAIVDILMPRLDGLELTRRLRADENKLPILKLTARDQVSDRALPWARGRRRRLPGQALRDRGASSPVFGPSCAGAAPTTSRRHSASPTSSSTRAPAR